MDNSHIPDSSPFRLFPSSPFPPKLFLDGLIVLGASLNPRDEPGRVARVRLTHALHHWRQVGAQSYLLLTGGVRPGCGCSEARAMADWALTWVAENWGDGGPGGLAILPDSGGGQPVAPRVRPATPCPWLWTWGAEAWAW